MCVAVRGKKKHGAGIGGSGVLRLAKGKLSLRLIKEKKKFQFCFLGRVLASALWAIW